MCLHFFKFLRPEIYGVAVMSQKGVLELTRAASVFPVLIPSLTQTLSEVS